MLSKSALIKKGWNLYGMVLVRGREWGIWSTSTHIENKTNRLASGRQLDSKFQNFYPWWIRKLKVLVMQASLHALNWFPFNLAWFRRKSTFNHLYLILLERAADNILKLFHTWLTYQLWACAWGDLGGQTTSLKFSRLRFVCAGVGYRFTKNCT